MKTALSIAGSDSSAGAGIQADIKAMTMNGVYATTAITALTAQNTTGVRAIMEVTPQFLAQQIDAVFEDIRPDAVKIGMVSSPELVNTIAGSTAFLSCAKYRRRSGRCCDQRFGPCPFRSSQPAQKRSSAYGDGHHPKHSRSTAAFGNRNPLLPADAAGCPHHQRGMWVRSPVQRRSQRQRRK